MGVPLLPILAAMPGIIQGASSLFDNKRRKAQEQKASQGISDLTDVFKTQLSGNYMDTPEVQRILAELTKRQGEQTRGMNATAATTGMTDEAMVAYQGKANEANANAIGGLAGGADIWRRQTQQQYGQGLNNLFNVGMNNRDNFRQNIGAITQPLQGSIDAGISTGAYDGLEIFGKKKIPKTKVGSIMDNNNSKNFA